VLWPDRDALGQCFKVGSDTVPCSTVVGIAEDIRAGSLTGEPGFLYYLSIAQFGPGRGGLFVRTRGAAIPETEPVRRALQQVMPGVSYVSVTPLDDVLSPGRRPWELGATMFTVFGALALLVAAVGLYSVISYGVAQRTHELGVRVALGARMRDVVGLVVGEGLRLAVLAVAIGVAVAMVAARWVAPLLFSTSPRDPLVYVAVTVTLVAIALLASVVPALRASRVDPNLALRSD
jgi:putative ABC transport system permease protein